MGGARGSGKRACRIADYGDGDVANIEQHDAYIDWFFERGKRFRQAIEMAASQLRQDWASDPLSTALRDRQQNVRWLRSCHNRGMRGGLLVCGLSRPVGRLAC